MDTNKFRFFESTGAFDSTSQGGCFWQEEKKVKFTRETAMVGDKIVTTKRFCYKASASDAIDDGGTQEADKEKVAKWCKNYFLCLVGCRATADELTGGDASLLFR